MTRKMASTSYTVPPQAPPETSWRVVWDLNNQKQIQESIVRISELENQGDALYATVIAQLFTRGGREAIEILKK